MKLVLIIFLLAFSSLGLGQSSTEVDDWNFPMTSNLICFDHEIPFFNYSADSVESFHFQLFNRWGELVAESDNFLFKLEESLKVKKEKMIENTYVGLIRMKIIGKQEKEFSINFVFLPFCNCG